jgi:hypothetical protein
VFFDAPGALSYQGAMKKIRRFRPQRIHALTEGHIWENRHQSRDDTAVCILRRVHGRRGSRFLIEGLDTKRQWTVTTSTLLGGYEPRGPSSGP